MGKFKFVLYMATNKKSGKLIDEIIQDFYDKFPDHPRNYEPKKEILASTKEKMPAVDSGIRTIRVRSLVIRWSVERSEKH